jgi:hypothetical protein
MRWIVLLMWMAAAARGEVSRLPDANRDGRTDLDQILGCLAYLERIGVVYDDRDHEGHVPVRRTDGRFHMVCVDLVTVCYRTAGYAFGGLTDPVGQRVRDFRQVVNLRARVQADPRFRYFAGPMVNPVATRWRPTARFRVGDMVFVDYSDAREYHAGIVTGVDPRTGLPTTVAQISRYTPDGGLHGSTFAEFFALSCRRLTGWARPAVWDRAPMSALERSLTVPARPRPRAWWRVSTPGMSHASHVLR